MVRLPFSRQRVAAVEVRHLRNTAKEPGPRPEVYIVSDEDTLGTICKLVQAIRSRGLKLAVP
jgi:hypothetical protein